MRKLIIKCSKKESFEEALNIFSNIGFEIDRIEQI